MAFTIIFNAIARARVRACAHVPCHLSCHVLSHTHATHTHIGVYGNRPPSLNDRWSSNQRNSSRVRLAQARDKESEKNDRIHEFEYELRNKQPNDTICCRRIHSWFTCGPVIWTPNENNETRRQWKRERMKSCTLRWTRAPCTATVNGRDMKTSETL